MITKRRPRDHTQLGRELAQLEDTDPEVRAAGERLDQVMEDMASPAWREHQALVTELYRDSRS